MSGRALNVMIARPFALWDSRDEDCDDGMLGWLGIFGVIV
jgi:hypothetical protein